MDTQEREVFAKEWLRGWNERDLTQILSHYSEDVEFQSPFAVHLFGETWRIIKGKEALASYFERGLAAAGKIEFEFLGVFHGVDSLVVHFRSKEFKCAEVMELNGEGKVRRAMAHLQV
jgi:hypothetical protein